MPEMGCQVAMQLGVKKISCLLLWTDKNSCVLTRKSFILTHSTLLVL